MFFGAGLHVLVPVSSEHVVVNQSETRGARDMVSVKYPEYFVLEFVEVELGVLGTILLWNLFAAPLFQLLGPVGHCSDVLLVSANKAMLPPVLHLR